MFVLCTIFANYTVQGVLGLFIVESFIRYKDTYEYCKNHVLTQCHKTAVSKAKCFLQLENVLVDVMMIFAHKKQ